ncbi:MULTISPECIES: antitoxin family protein [Planktothrix]|nr:MULTISPECIES: antitoxin family protein [Planktothrix]
MPKALKAIYQNGTFILKNPCNLPEGVEVELFVQSPQVISPQITDIDARQHFLKQLVERMQ